MTVQVEIMTLKFVFTLGKPPVDESGKPLYGDVFGTSDSIMSQQIQPEEIDPSLWGELESESEEEVFLTNNVSSNRHKIKKCMHRIYDLGVRWLRVHVMLRGHVETCLRHRLWDRA